MGKKRQRERAARAARAQSTNHTATIDYQHGQAGFWHATVTIDGYPPATRTAADAHEAMHEALDYLDKFINEHPEVTGLFSVHTLDGDPAAWMRLASEQGFLDCAHSRNSVSTPTTLSSH